MATLAKVLVLAVLLTGMVQTPASAADYTVPRSATVVAVGQAPAIAKANAQRRARAEVLEAGVDCVDWVVTEVASGWVPPKYYHTAKATALCVS
ncbi:hypothetical protein [Actinokineospora globicatena]|uniref:hypothetical protein n=1 Tax=Actinokineospora globicatena TaxID=103729 RepID=UPI0020A4221A|nr:hypothetical protein [Actinokineospora globicatena]MCP2303685.1 hypothetical protein [Actinokineospora globicatena]GLW79177.1 hypothetical protein Aglo01_36590 [Actinokineospora globicatena]GLW86413.1 hypothetical protein Aglo02_40520 [Actinokineospora globicatena]